MGVGRNGNLIPPKKGEIRNPKGYPKGIPNAKTRYLRLLTLTEKIKNPVTGKLEEFTVMEQLDMQMIRKARSGDIRAYQEIMDRLEGKARQELGMDLSGSINVAMVEFLDAPDDNKNTNQDTQPVS